jgi:regulatory protein
MERALRLIGVRARTESELHAKLVRGGAAGAVAQGVCSRLKELGYVDDEEFARRWLEERLALRPAGRRLLLSDLLRKGVPRQVAERSLTGYDAAAELRAALRLVTKQCQKYGGADSAERVRRCYRYLLGRGFDYQTSGEAVRRLEAQPQAGLDIQGPG